ncbi:MAG TPA: aminoglycoside adenylyltransferase domain-containing protein [Streptosporangiaceae bacterium]|nr:aminoglycoside adenylyltransferase domain-containing protein [Streptosporangiaceae bacterium]
MDHPAHPWPAAVARHIAGDLAEVAGGRLVAVYLHGSAVLGGWVPGRSDVDVLVVVSDEIGDATLDSMAHAIVSARPERPPEDRHAPKLESSIVAVAAARRPAPPWPFFRHVVTDPAEPARIVRPEGVGQGDRDLLMHYAVCRTAGYPAFGPPAREVVGPIARTDVLSYLADELSWGLANAPERYAVLNACRAALYLTDGIIVSKIGGGEAALVRRTGPADVVTRALAQQRRTQPDQPPADDAIAFVEATIAMLRAGT